MEPVLRIDGQANQIDEMIKDFIMFMNQRKLSSIFIMFSNEKMHILALLLFLVNECPFFAQTNGYSAKMNKVYHVEDYDINPDGSSVFTKLQWLTDMVSRDGGGTIQFSSGTYVIGCNTNSNKSAIKLRPNVTYKGVCTKDQRYDTILKANNEEISFYSIFYTSDDKVKNVTFENIVFDTYIGKRNGAYTNSNLRSAILLAKSDSIIIRNCKFICVFMVNIF